MRVPLKTAANNIDEAAEALSMMLIKAARVSTPAGVIKPVNTSYPKKVVEMVCAR